MIPKYHCIDKNDPAGIIIEFVPNGNLYHHVDKCKRQGFLPSKENIYRWAHQAASAISFAHSLGIFHSDIHNVNFLLDSELDLRVADWAGASIDGSKSW